MEMSGGMPGRLSANLDDNLDTIRNLFNGMPDLTVRRFRGGSIDAALIYLAYNTDAQALHERLMQPIISAQADASGSLEGLLQLENKRTDEWQTLSDAVVNGYAVLMVNDVSAAHLFDLGKFPKRQPKEPQTETVMKGSHVGFNESLQDNLAVIRYYLNDTRLVCRTFTIGERVQSTCALLYLKDVTNEAWIEEMASRIEAIRVDGIINIGILEEALEDTAFTVFPQLIVTERPDVTVSHLLHGRVAVLLDKTAGSVIAPVSFESFFQSIEDYAQRWPVASFIRLLRMVCFLIAVFLPSVYIAALSFHYEIIPMDLILSIGRSRQQVPLPPIIEALIMETVLEMLREAGLRLPSRIGQTVGIVGGIVIGQAAVQAGIVSNIMVVVVAFTAVASFIQPQQDMAAAIRLLRFPMMLVAFMFGAVGIVCGIMALAAHIIGLQSLRTPYGSPFGPVHLTEWKDTWVRLPRWTMRTRPVSLRPKQAVSQGKHHSNSESSGEEGK